MKIRMKTWKNVVEEDRVYKKLIMAFYINSSGQRMRILSTSYYKL